MPFERLEAALGRQSLPLEEAVPLYAELMALPLPEGRYQPLALSAEQKLDALAGWLLEEAERRPVLQVCALRYQETQLARPAIRDRPRGGLPKLYGGHGMIRGA